MDDSVIQTVEKTGKVIGAASAVIAAAAAARRFLIPIVSREIKARRLIHGLLERFGQNAADVLADNLKALHIRQDRHTAKFTLMLKRMNIGLFICDAEGFCTWSNPPLWDILGLHESQVSGYGWLEAVVREERVAVHENWRWSVKNGTPYKDEYTIDRDGQRFKCRAEAFAHHAADGRTVLFYLGYVEQIP